MSPHWMRATLLACGLVMLPPAAPAQDYPSKTIKIIVPNPPGGGGDIAARFIAQKLTDSVHQPVIVENQAGASGTLGMNMVKRAAADGYTLGVVISLAQVIDRMQNKTASFDLTKDFTPLTAIANNPIVLLTNASIPVTSFQDFLAYVRARPGKISYSTAGIGTAHYVYGELLNHLADLKMVNVPYKGTAPALNDLLGAHVQAGVITLSSALPHIRAGTVHALAMFDVKRNDKLPDVPTITEVMPNYEAARSWIGLLGPADLPPAVAAKLNGEIVHILQSKEGERVLGDAGLDVVANSQAEFAEMMRKDTQLWEQAATQIGLFSQ